MMRVFMNILLGRNKEVKVGEANDPGGTGIRRDPGGDGISMAGGSARHSLEIA
jgi:hypothetical protein